MSNEALETACQVMIGVGLLIGGIGGYGAYHHGRNKEHGKQSWNKTCQVMIFLGIVIVASSGYGAYHYDKEIQKDSEKETAMAGMIKGDEEAVKTQLAIGGIKIELSGETNVVIDDYGEEVLSIRTEDDKLYITTVVRSEDGKVIAKLTDNEWEINQNNYLDRNYTDNALEVKNEKDRIVLQVVNFGDTIHFAGVFHTKDGHVVSLMPIEDGNAAIEIRGCEEDLILNIDSIFEFPSSLYFGVCEGLQELEETVRNGTSTFYFGASVNIGVYNKDAEKIIKLL